MVALAAEECSIRVAAEFDHDSDVWALDTIGAMHYQNSLPRPGAS